MQTIVEWFSLTAVCVGLCLVSIIATYGTIVSTPPWGRDTWRASITDFIGYFVTSCAIVLPAAQLVAWFARLMGWR